ncbi:spore germination protein [Paenibacillus koleovorans]|uniref:spore germination protein n=1 Tax=Paenibacillus koleovorans TaxID=121608 RepID=UPI000FDAA6C5|nr:spore germination protein [Paenibacillus koleovorans]
MNKRNPAGWERALIEQMSKQADFTIRTVSILGQPRTMYYLKSMVSLSQTLDMLDSLLSESTPLDPSMDNLVVDWVLRGNVLVGNSDSDAPLGLRPVKLQHNRPIMTSQIEQPLQVSFDSFTEELYTNIGLLRKKLIRPDLAVETFTTGTSTRRDLALVYIQGEAKESIVSFVKQKLHDNLPRDIHNVSDLLKMLDQPRFSLVPTYLSTELPEETSQNLLEGKVILLIDQFPFALAFPAIIKDLWSLKSDLNYPPLFRMFSRFIRIAGLLFAVVTPGMYIIMNSVNPELLRIQLAISVAKSREGVPYPAIIEVFLMMLMLEMVIEATIRLPKSIGPTITMIGGIILGQAIVQAHLVSNLLIIVLATSTIANFTMAGFLNTIGIRIFKYATILCSTMFGIFGLEASIIWLCVYLAGLNASSVPYLSFSLKGRSSHE